MRILYLSQLVPYPPDAGAKVRIYYTLRYLAQSHEVSLVAFSRPDDHPGAVEHLRSFCSSVDTIPVHRSKWLDGLHLADCLLHGNSFIVSRERNRQMAEKVDELLTTHPVPLSPLGEREKFDAVHADQIYMVEYGLQAKKLAGMDIPMLVVDKHNADFLIVQRLAAGETNPFKRLLLQREWRLLRHYEAQACAQFDHLVTVTTEDRLILEKLIGDETQKRFVNNQNSHTIPICVDTDDIQPVTPQPGAQGVVYLGGLHWPPNAQGVSWFGREVWPRVKEQIPGATFTIVGKNPAKAVQDLAEGDRAIRITGYVPDPQPCLEAAGVFIVPLFAGSGMRVKIVDAWRWGLPVVSTTIGAEGIEYRDGENILIADTAEDFARAVVRVLSEPELNRALRQNGRRWVEEHYDWRRIYPAWDEIYGR